MPVLVHLTPEKNVKRILHAGIHKGRGVYCMPVLQSYYVSHQWLRELKRRGVRTLVGVYFRVPDEEMVWFGRYGQPHQYIPVTEAIHLLMQQSDQQGYEMIIPRYPSKRNSQGPGRFAGRRLALPARSAPTRM